MRTTTFRMTVKGRPRAHQRHRARIIRSGKKAFVQTYDPAANKEWRAKIQDAWHEAQKSQAPWDPTKTVRLEVLFLYRCAKPPRKGVPRPAEYRAKRPDIDNLLKGIMDGLNGLAWADDSQVAEVSCIKLEAEQGTNPRVEITLDVLDGSPPIAYTR